jgi:2-dehydro-3-deoxygalactonokinase
MLFRDSVQDIPLVLSGMASSSIGMLELPYRQMPFQCDGSDLHVHVVTQEQGIQHKVLIISGVRSEEDVIRGEETMMAGCRVAKDDRQQLFIFPGTHSKHMMVRNAVVENFSTYMTGELFDLLSNKSILSASMKKSTSLTHDINGYFTRGVIKGASSNIMNSIFHVRTNQLFKKATPEENYQYLSGLLIGHELQYVAGTRPALITLVCSEGLKSHYYQALTALGLADLLHYHNADDALIRGQLNIMKLKAV